MVKKKIKIEEHQLLDLIHWARRYCDRRRTYAPSSFNQLYDEVVQLNPQIREKDRRDETLMEDGRYWPYAQDYDFDEKAGRYDARPKLSKLNKLIGCLNDSGVTSQNYKKMLWFR